MGSNAPAGQPRRLHVRHIQTREDRPSTHRPTRSASPRAWAQGFTITQRGDHCIETTGRRRTVRRASMSDSAATSRVRSTKRPTATMLSSHKLPTVRFIKRHLGCLITKHRTLVARDVRSGGHETAIFQRAAPYHAVMRIIATFRPRCPTNRVCGPQCMNEVFFWRAFADHRPRECDNVTTPVACRHTRY